MFSFSATNMERVSGLGEDSVSVSSRARTEGTQLGGSRPAREDHRSLKRMRSGAVCRVQREEGFVPARTHTWSNGVPSPHLPLAHRSRSRFPPRGGAGQGAVAGVGLR